LTADEGKLDSAIVSALWDEQGEALRRFLVGVLKDPALAADAMQAAWMKLVEQGHTVQPGSRKSWLFQVAYREALLLRRRQATGDNVLRRLAWVARSHAAASDESAMLQELVARVRAALDELPAGQRQVVRMRIYEQKTFAEIADELGIPLGTALGRMRAATAKLRARLDVERGGS